MTTRAGCYCRPPRASLFDGGGEFSHSHDRPAEQFTLQILVHMRMRIYGHGSVARHVDGDLWTGLSHRRRTPVDACECRDAKTALPVSNRFVGVVEVVRSIHSKDRALTPDNRHDRALQGPPCLIVNDSPVVASASGAGEDASRREDRYLSQKAFNRQTPSRSITKITGNEYVLPLSWRSIWYSTLRRRTARAIRCWRR